MQALMLAAGMGSRLGKFTKNNTKCMLEVAGQKLIDRAIDAVEVAGIHRFCIVTGYRGEELRQYILTNYAKRNMEFVFIHNEHYAKTNNIYSLWLARKEFAREDTILLESDLIFETSLIKEMCNASDETLVAVDRLKPWMDGTVVNLDANNNVVCFIEKKDIDINHTEDYYKTVNIYKFSTSFIQNVYLPFLDAYIRAYGKNEYYETVIKAIAHLGRNHLKAFDLHGRKWYEIDDAQDYDIATTMFSKGETQLRLMQGKYGGYWRYDDLLDFCYLVNPYFPSAKMSDKLKASFDVLLRQYPSGLNIQNMGIGRMFNIDESFVLTANGAAEIINHLRAVLKGKLGVCLPTFNEYVRCFPDNEICPLYTSETDYRYDVNRLLNHLDQVDNLVLINPDNPSGSLIKQKDLFLILERATLQGKRVVVDESFIDFADPSERYTMLKDDLLKKYPCMIVVKSISKSYGVPGLRLGLMATSDKQALAIVRQALPVWNINSFAEYFLQIFTLYQKDYLAACDRIAEERNRLSIALKELGLTVYPSAANFVLVKLPNGINSTELTIKMLEQHKILLKDLYRKDTFDQPQYLRIAVRDQSENDRLLVALKECLCE